MSETFPVKIIAHIHTDFPTKFGVPRQSGLIDSLESLIIFEPEYRDPLSLRGLEEFFPSVADLAVFQGRARYLVPHRAPRQSWEETAALASFATRSPFRPNAIGLSSVRLLGIEKHPQHGHVLRVAGADLMDGTPILDIKPYLAYTDSHPQATGGFTDRLELKPLEVLLPPELGEKLPADKRAALLEVLAADPRPSYQHDPERVYGFAFGSWEVYFLCGRG